MEKFIRWIVWRLPKRIIYWSTLRLGAKATSGKYCNQVISELNFFDALNRW